MKNSTWDDIYNRGEQLNDYPFDEVISFVRRYGKSGQQILELGCGAGNNLIWAVKEGFRVTGLDQSLRAIQYAGIISEREGLYPENYCFMHFDFTKDFGGNFDLIIDRYATTYLHDDDEIFKLNHKISSVLTPGGYYFTQLASKANTLKLDPEPNLYTPEDIGTLFSGWELISCKHRQDVNLMTDESYAVWNIIARKPLHVQ